MSADTSREAVERLACRYERVGMRDDALIAATLRALLAERDAATAQRDAERHEVRNGFLEGYEAGWAAALENAASETPYDEPQCDAAWSDSAARVRLAHIRFPDAPTGAKP